MTAPLPISSVLLNSEEELMLGLRSHHSQAIATLYDRYSQSAYYIFLRYTGNPSVAEDLIQELFFRVWRRGAQFDPNKGNVKDWVLSSARHMAIDYRRSAIAKTEELMSYCERMTEHRDAESATWRRAGANFQEFLSDSLASLSGQHKQIMELAYLEGCSQSEISDRLKVPLGTIKSRVRAALAQLRMNIETNARKPSPG